MAEDIVLVLLAHAGVVSGGGQVAKPLSRRLQALLFEALGLLPAGALPAAPSAARVYLALRKLQYRKLPSA